MLFYADIYTSKDRHFRTDKQMVDFEVEAKSLSFDYHGYYFYEGIYHHTNEAFVDEVSIKVDPASASTGYSMAEGGSFTSSDPDVATFDNKGKFVPGTKEGRTTITLTQPSGTKETLIVANPIQKVSATGINAPVVGEKFDLTADVPAGANYTVKEVYWTEGYSGDKLAADAVAEEYRSYVVHVVFQEKNGQEFTTDDYRYWVDGAYEHIAKQPYELTVTLADGTEETVSGTLYGSEENVWKANRQNTVSATYGFPAYVEDGSDQIDTIIINLPTEVAQGDLVQDYLDQIEVKTAAGSAVSVTTRVGYAERADDIASALGYDTAKLPVFIKGVQHAVNFALSIPSELSPRFVDDNIKVILNGEEYTEAEVLGEETYLNIAIYDAYTIKDGTEIRKAPVFNVDNVYMVVGESINLNDLLTGDENLEYTVADSFSNDYADYYAETNVLVAKKPFTGTGRAEGGNYINGIVMWDINGDGINETPISRPTRVVIVDSEEDLPDISSCKFTINAKNPDGTDAYTVNRYLDYEDASDGYVYYKFSSIPEIDNAIIKGTSSDPSVPFSVQFGANNVRTYFVDSNSNITVETISADSVRIAASTDEAYAIFDGSPAGICVSIDNETFYGGNRIDGLKPGTEYTLYYKQGPDGTVYSKSFRTATQDYGVSVGMTRVTDKTLGNLDTDGWHYDPSSNTLTLKNLTLETKGVSALKGSFAGVTGTFEDGVIVSDHDLTVELIGENSLKHLGGSGSYKYAFYYKKTTSKAFTAIGEEYGNATSATFTPASTGEYNVRINVMDSNGTLVVKQYKITSTAALTNNSTISAASVSVGSAVTITGAANGGSGDYTYQFTYRKSTSKYPTEITPEGNTAVFKPGSKAEYIVTVSVTDSAGTVVEKQFTVTST